MKDESSAATGGSLGFCGVLGIVFIVLKLCGVIDWSWWWVTSPLWIPLAIVIVVVLIIMITAIIRAIAEGK